MWTPLEPVADSEFSPPRRRGRSFPDALSSSPGNRHPQPPRCDGLAERPLQVLVRHEILGTANSRSSGVVSDDRKDMYLLIGGACDGSWGRSIDQCYGALRRRPADFYMFDELCWSQQGSDHRVPKKKIHTRAEYGV